MVGWKSEDAGCGWLRAELHLLFVPFRFFFRSGNIEHPGDKLFNTSVEVLPFDVSLPSPPDRVGM